MMSKKGQGISINVIIIAAIGLAVLVVLFAIFTGRIGIFSKGIGETASCANACKGLGLSVLRGQTNDETCASSGGTYVAGTYSDVQPNACCCK